MRKELSIGDYTIELMDTDLVPVTKKVYDLTDPSKRSSSFTKTITIPSSRVNNQIFASYFDISMSLTDNGQFNPYFNPAKRVPSVYYEDTLEIINGYIQLVSINIEDKVTLYELQLYGENAEIFKDIEGKKLADLDLSLYDHTYSKGVIKDSWSRSVYKAGVLTQSTFGDGYVYPHTMNGRRTNLSIIGANQTSYWKTADFDCFVYVKTIWDRIFFEAGKKYKSTFLTSDAFKKLIYKGGQGFKRSEAEIQHSLINYNQADSFGFRDHQGNYTTRFLYANNSLVGYVLLQDNNSNFNAGVLTVAETGDYDIYYNMEVTVKNETGLDMNIKPYRGDIMLVDEQGNPAVLAHMIDGTTPNNFTPNTQFSRDFANNVINAKLVAGRKYKWVFAVYSGLITMFLYNFEFSIFLNGDVNEGEEVNLTRFLSPEMTQKDFIMSFVKMFNLYFEPYYYNPSDAESGGYLTYLIEPRDTYYTDEIIDWTKKLDKNRSFEIKPLGFAENKFIKFTYDADKDYFNEYYSELTGRVYGDLTVDIENEFLTGTKEVKIPFSLMVQATASSGNINVVTPIPFDVKDKDFGGRANEKSKSKILYYSGVFNLSDSWLFGSDAAGTNITTERFTPFAAHYTLGGAQKFDLLFDTAEKYFFTDINGNIQIGNIGLYPRYHKKGIVETNNKNSKRLECYMNLTPLDVHNLSLRPIYEIEGNHYRLYEMTDYNGNETTKCTFLKLEISADYEQVIIDTKGGGGTIGDPTIIKDTINGMDLILRKDLIRGANVVSGGVIKTPILTDNVVSLALNNQSLSEDRILVGNEGSPFSMYYDTTSANKNLLLPPESLNIGKVYNLVNYEGANNLIVKDEDDVELFQLKPNESAVCQITETGVKFIKTLSATNVDLILKTASNQVNDTITLDDIPLFNFPVVSGKIYKISMSGGFQTAATTTGIKLGVYLTGGATGTIFGSMSALITTVTEATELKAGIFDIGSSNITGSFILTTGVGFINLPHPIYADLIFTCTATGVFRFQMASEVATSAATLLQNSIVEIKEL